MLAPFILNVFNQIHHVFINEAIDTIQRYLISVVARFEWREYQCQYIIIHFHEMHLVIQFKRAFDSCQWKYKMSQFNQ